MTIVHVFSLLLWIVAPLACIGVPVGMFNTALFKAQYGTKCTGMNLVKAYTPITNIIFPRKIVYGTSKGFTALIIVAASLFVFRIAAIFLARNAPLIFLASVLAMYLCILIYAILYIVCAVDFAQMLCPRPIMFITCVILPPAAFYAMSTQVLRYFAEVSDEVTGRFESKE